MKYYKNILWLIIVLFCQMPIVKAQQDPLYNLYSFNQFMVNPAYAGIYNNFNANLITRKQWAGIEGAPLTNMLSFHSSVADKFGAGLLLVNDRLGINNNMEGQLAFSYKLFTGKKTLAFGVQGGIIHYGYDYSKLNTDNLSDPALNVQYDNFNKANFGAGLFYMTDNYYLGVSVPRILNVEVENNMVNSKRYEPHFYLSGGFILKSKSVSSLLFKPSFLVRYTTNHQVSADISLSALLANTVWTGFTVRNLDALAITAQLQVSRSFRFGYSFEFPTNKLSQQNYGTHELSLLLELNLFKNQYDIERYF